MTDNDILLSDLNDISEILNNDGYGGWCKTIRKAVAMLKEQERKLDSIICFENGDKVRLWHCPLRKSEVRIVLKGR